MFEIHAPGIDTEQVIRAVDERIGLNKSFNEESERIRKLTFSPGYHVGEANHKAAVAAELFERPVAIPDFKNRSWFLRGPFRRIALAVFNITSQIYEKLSENRVQAFYNVSYEIISLNYRQKQFQEIIAGILEENLQLRNEMRELANGKNTLTTRDRIPKSLPEEDFAIGESSERLIKKWLKITSDKINDKILVVDDDFGHFSNHLKLNACNNLSLNTSNYFSFLYLKYNIGLDVVNATPDEFLILNNNSKYPMIAVPNLSQLNGRKRLFLDMLCESISDGGVILLRWIGKSKNEIFCADNIPEINKNALKDFFLEKSFQLVEEYKSEKFSENSFEWVLQKS